MRASCSSILVMLLAFPLGCSGSSRSTAQSIAPAAPSASAPVALQPYAFELLDSQGKLVRPPAATQTGTLRLTAHTADGLHGWHLELVRVDAVRDAGNGKVWVVGNRSLSRDSELLLVDQAGRYTVEPLPSSCWQLGGPVAADGTMVAASCSTYSDVQVLALSPGAQRLGSLALQLSSDRAYGLTSRGNLFIASNAGSLDLLRADGSLLWQGTIPVPTGDIAYRWRPLTNYNAYVWSFESGDVWILAPDRRVVAHGPNGQRRFALGVREAPDGLWPLANGDVLIGTKNCEILRLRSSGETVWQTRLGTGRADACRFSPNFVKESRNGELAIRIPEDGYGNLWVLGADGTPRWATAVPSEYTYHASLNWQGTDTVRVTERNGRSMELGPTSPRVPIPERQRARAAVFSQQLSVKVDSGIALAPDQAIANSGLRIWIWNGATWRGGEPLQKALAPRTTESVNLGGRFTPNRLERGPGGEVWLSGWLDIVRAAVRDGNDIYQPSDLCTVLRQRGNRWVEHGALRATFAEHRLDDFLAFRANNAHEYAVRVATGVGSTLICSNTACVVENGKHLDLGDVQVAALGQVANKPWVLTTNALVEFDGRGFVERAPAVEGSRLWGAQVDDVWVFGDPAAEGQLKHLDASNQWVWMRSPVGPATGIWGTAADDVWLTGNLGVAHWDGRAWQRVVGLDEPVTGLFGAGANVWFTTASGLWHFERWLPVPDLHRPMPPAPEPDAELAPLDQRHCTPDEFELQRFTTAVEHARPLVGATEIATAPDGTTWFRDRERVVELNADKAIVLDSTAASSIHSTLAPIANGRGFVLGTRGIARVEGGKETWLPTSLLEPQAIAVDGVGRLWAVAASDVDEFPHAFMWNDQSGEYSSDVPPAAYVAVATRGSDELWIAGGLHSTRDGVRIWPAGEGIVVHRSHAGSRWYRVPAGALLGITGVGPGEAWAVGAAGLVVHIKAGRLESRRLGSGVWLRDVEGTTPNDIWIVGDDGTLLHGDANSFDTVQNLPLPARSALTSLAPRGPNHVWVASPDGILDVKAMGRCGVAHVIHLR